MTYRALAICEPCDGYGVLMHDCGKRCGACDGLGHRMVSMTEDQFFAHLPPGMTREEAKDLIRRIRDRAQRARERQWWSPYPEGNDRFSTEKNLGKEPNKVSIEISNLSDGKVQHR